MLAKYAALLSLLIKYNATLTIFLWYHANKLAFEQSLTNQYVCFLVLRNKEIVDQEDKFLGKE